MKDEHGYPFQAECERRQAEPMPECGIDWNVYCPYSLENLPPLERAQKIHFNQPPESRQKASGACPITAPEG